MTDFKMIESNQSSNQKTSCYIGVESLSSTASLPEGEDPLNQDTDEKESFKRCFNIATLWSLVLLDRDALSSQASYSMITFCNDITFVSLIFNHKEFSQKKLTLLTPTDELT